MAYWIDRAFLWLFAAFSSLLFFLVITDGMLVLSILAAFLLVLTLRMLLQKMPDKRLFQRRVRRRRIHQLLKTWALMEESQALSDIRKLLPDLFNQSVWPCVHLIQRMPDSEPFSANQLLNLRRAFKTEETLYLLCTCNISSEAAALLPELSSPAVRIVDSDQIRRILMKSPVSLPDMNTKKERYRPFNACIARFIQAIRPVRTALYSLLFLAIHLMTQSRFYLIAALLFILQLIIYLISKIAAMQKAA